MQYWGITLSTLLQISAPFLISAPSWMSYFSSKDPYFNKHPLLISTLLQKWYSLHGVDWLDFSKLCGLLSHLNVILKKKTAWIIVQFQEMSILLPLKGLKFPGGGGGSLRPKNLKKCIKFNWNFQRGRGSCKKSLPWGRYGYFLELNNVTSEPWFLIHLPE